MLKEFPCNTVDGSEILHQLRLVVFPIIYKILYIPGGDRRISEPSTVVHEVWVGIMCGKGRESLKVQADTSWAPGYVSCRG